MADIPDLDACSALGQTPEAALTEVEKAKQLWLDAARATGKPIPHRATAQRSIKPGKRTAQGRGRTLDCVACERHVLTDAFASALATDGWRRPISDKSRLTPKGWRPGQRRDRKSVV